MRLPWNGHEGLAKLVEAVLNQVLEAQVTEALSAERHERNEERSGYRNGTRTRTLYTRVGTVTLLVPQTREGTFSTNIFNRYQRSEQAFVLALMEMVVQGFSTRKKVHLMRNMLGHASTRVRAEVAAAAKLIFQAADMEEAKRRLAEFVERFKKKAPKAVACIEEGFNDAMAVMALPEKYRKRLRSTNMQERLNEEIRRRERVIRIFPNDESALRLIGALLAEQNELWQERRYLDMDEFAE